MSSASPAVPQPPPPLRFDPQAIVSPPPLILEDIHPSRGVSGVRPSKDPPQRPGLKSGARNGRPCGTDRSVGGSLREPKGRRDRGAGRSEDGADRDSVGTRPVHSARGPDGLAPESSPVSSRAR